MEAGIFFIALGVIGLAAKGIYFAEPPISHRGWIMTGIVVFVLVMVFVASLISGSSPALGYMSLMFMMLAVPAILLGAFVQVIVWLLKRRKSDSPSRNE